MLSRRAAITAPLFGLLPALRGASPTMTVSIHQTTSRDAGYRKMLEGWAKAGIRQVELTDSVLEPFLKTEDLNAARRVLTDNGLTPVSSTSPLPDVWITGPARPASLDTWKKRCEQFASLGLTKIYCPSITNRKVTAEDYKSTPECIREAAEIARQHSLTAMIEFTRSSTHLATLPTALNMLRAANHPNAKLLFDFYHFYSGLSKLEDLDLLKPGELGHVHFQDTPDMPRELLDSTTRLIPGDGIAPIEKILRKLAEKGYAGPLSVELFAPEFQKADPFELAKQIKQKCEAQMSKAGVA